ncbi:MAG: chitobiase/beta-hexosaminidase C-terminal domain-containing protein [Verrucomicrobia bacterium]|nr:chitobiase/beta-hexosaminidase C-terminal domain-containing protein [Verrucomicrobiota bacterium]MCH8526973.1 chitobiase/beta-hexosaminidase C-terminal domain-containing protein [Kiritimatiellia bacterium]
MKLSHYLLGLALYIQAPLSATPSALPPAESDIRDFLNMLILDPADMARTGLDKRPLLVETSRLYREENHIEAMETFTRYLLEKLREGEAYGLPPGVRPGDLPNNFNLDAANRLLDGTFTLGGEPIGEPGQVTIEIDNLESIYGYRDRWHPGLFTPLLYAYIQTGRTDYLNRWAAYIDDWVDQGRGLRDTEALRISDGQHHLSGRILWEALSMASHLREDAARELPHPTLARLMNRMVTETVPATILYHRTNPQNWTPGGSVNMIRFAMLIDEFKVARTLFEEGMRRIENYNSLQNYPDGSETEQAPWYNRNWLNHTFSLREIFATRGASGRIPSWEREIIGSNRLDVLQLDLDRRVNFLVRFITPQAELPIGMRNDRRDNRGWRTRDIQDIAPAVFERPSIQQLIDTVNHNHTLKYRDPDLHENSPETTADSFPYSGFFLLRNSWHFRSSYAHLTSAPNLAGGHALTAMKGNNSLGLAADRLDLLHSGSFGTYSYDRSPLRVDGFEQFAHAGIPRNPPGMAHKGLMADAREAEPAPWRFHSSSRFDLAEGVYDGPYGFLMDDHHDQGVITPDMVSEASLNAIHDVPHQRLVMGDRASGLWIVTDRIHSREPRDFSLDWRLPSLPHPNPERRTQPVFDPERVQLNEQAKTIKTDDDDMRVNLHMYQFSAMPLRYSSALETGEHLKEDYSYRYRLYALNVISSQWRGQGPQQVVTLLHPKGWGAEGDIEVTETATGHTNGFRVRLPDGEGLLYQSAIHGTATFSIGRVRAVGEAVLLRSDGSGLLLGGTEFELNGEPVEMVSADMEFRIEQGRVVETTPIYRPIKPVQIKPARKRLLPGEHITLSTSTENEVIRYTLDGSEPDLSSPVYEGPIPVQNPLTLKARAFRPDLAEIPVNESLTHASEISRADVEITALLNPVDAGDLLPGLAYIYMEGTWKALSFFPEKDEPLKHGTVKELLDVSPRNPDAPYYAFVYSGYLKVPEDGVYTLHLPEEYLRPAIMAGYELSAYLGRDDQGGSIRWQVTQDRFALGTWSVGLRAGLHPIHVRYADVRGTAPAHFNRPGFRDQVWTGQRPDLRISGPTLSPGPVPSEWLFHQAQP